MINLVHLKDPDCFIHSNGTVWSYDLYHSWGKRKRHKLYPGGNK